MVKLTCCNSSPTCVWQHLPYLTPLFMKKCKRDLGLLISLSKFKRAGSWKFTTCNDILNNDLRGKFVNDVGEMTLNIAQQFHVVNLRKIFVNGTVAAVWIEDHARLLRKFNLLIYCLRRRIVVTCRIFWIYRRNTFQKIYSYADNREDWLFRRSNRTCLCLMFLKRPHLCTGWVERKYSESAKS